MHAHDLRISSLASLPPEKRDEALGQLSDEECEALLHDWRFLARDAQLAPEGNWSTWMFLAGRGSGKTRAGAEWVRQRIKAGSSRIALIGPTAADTRDVMVEGESGLLSVCWEGDHALNGDYLGRPVYEPSRRQITWANGAMAKLYSAEEPERLRGPQHSDGWCDELGAWKRAQDTWDMFQFGLRLGTDPRAMVTTTPRPIETLREILGDPTTQVTTGSMYDNRAFLAATFIRRIRHKYEGTRLGRQEIFAELLTDVPGALWTDGMIRRGDPPPRLRRVVVAVDPSGTGDNEEGDDIGIVVAGLGADGLGYVLDDATLNAGPTAWGEAVVECFHEWRADRVIAEVNFGGALVESNIRAIDNRIPFKAVRANPGRGKVVRAEPVAALYEQGRVVHCGTFGMLESQMRSMTRNGYSGRGSPDRLDALVWALSELMLDGASGLPRGRPRFATLDR